MSNNKEEIKKLINDCKNGDELAYKRLYENYYVILMRIAQRYSRDKEEAKDYFQNIYMKIVSNLNKYDFKGSFEGWLKRIAVNESINYYKRINKSNLMTYENDDNKVLSNQKQLSDKNIFAKFEHEELMELVSELPSAYKTVFNLYVIDDFSHKEIAEKLEISIGTSKSNLSRARAILKKKVLEIQEYEKRNAK